MRILLDENIGAETEKWLRSGGHDVLSAADLLGSTDEAVYRTACETDHESLVSFARTSSDIMTDRFLDR